MTNKLSQFFINYMKNKNISKDWGGYGIIAPDFREFI